MPNQFQIRPMEPDDLEWALSLAKAEGWNPGLKDAEAFYAADPKGFFVGTLGKERVSSISAVAYDGDYGFLGLYIVHPDYRGKAYGIQTWRKAISYLGERCIGLDGVVAQQANYGKSGFTLAYRQVRYGGTAVGRPLAQHVTSLQKVPFEAILSYDVRMFGALRERFLRLWLKNAAAAFAVVDKGNIKGYGVARRCHDGYKIGPLFAEDADTANSLFEALCSAAAPASVFIDVPEPNKSGLALAERHKLEPVFETARMYTETPPEFPVQMIFGVTSFELG